MKMFKKLRENILKNKSRKSRIMSVKLALKTDLQGHRVTDIAATIHEYINKDS